MLRFRGLRNNVNQGKIMSDYLLESESELGIEFEVENGTWLTKEGKLVKYTKESCQLNSYDDYSEYYLQITTWPKTRSIEIVVISGDEGHDSESRWSHSRIYRLTKLPHAQFDEQRDELIEKILKLANEQIGFLSL